jgi:hypothetical protein
MPNEPKVWSVTIKRSQMVTVEVGAWGEEDAVYKAFDMVAKLADAAWKNTEFVPIYKAPFGGRE